MNVYDILNIKQPARKPRRMRGGDTETVKHEPVNENGNTTQQPHSQRNITLQKATDDSTVEKYDPVITRPILSIYEYAEVHTLLAEYLQDQRTIAGFTNDVEIRSNVSPVEVAFYVLKEGKWDATIDRGYEKVSYSRLKYNPQWASTIEHYFKQQHQIEKNELFQPLGLV